MVRFHLRLAAFAALQLVVAGLVFRYGSPHNTDHYLAAIHDKRALLASTEPPRLILVGGSNIAFGIDSQRFEAPLGRPPINFGLHAALGLDVPLRLVEEAVGQGDIVVVCFEYALLATRYYQGGRETIAQLLEQWPGARHYYGMDPEVNIRQVLDHDALWITHQWVRRARHALRRRHKSGGVYTRSGFNQYGDMVGHHGAESKMLSHAKVLGGLDERWVERAVERLNRFNAHCRDKGAFVLFCYPPLPQDVFDNSRESIAKLARMLKRSLDIPILHEPNEVAYPRDFFYDTVYHLTRTGTQQRSNLLLTCLEHELKRVASEPSDARSRNVVR